MKRREGLISSDQMDEMTRDRTRDDYLQKSIHRRCWVFGQRDVSKIQPVEKNT